MNRREFLSAGTLALIANAPLAHALAPPHQRFSHLPPLFAALEKTNSARLGASLLDTGSGETAGHRATERFAMCSTFKILLAAAILQRSDAGTEHLDRTLPIPPKPILPYSPFTEPNAGAAMTISDLCHAILTRSDNTAANLLLATIGGPAGVTAFARSIDDQVTRLDRTETSLNDALPGDPRDTTSPEAMLGNLKTLLLGNVLSRASRDRLIQWMIGCQPGDNRLRTNLPPDWRAGDKGGANGETTTNDIAILWPTGQAPILITAYLTECPGPETKRNAILAQVSRLIVSSIQGA